MNLHWVEDPDRRSRCWDLRNDKDTIVGWVIKSNGRWEVRPYPSILSHAVRYDTKEEAMAVLVALVRFT